ncbi:MAG: hypothetical protein SX243_25175 [Acidobacteriota bacterium]|nr:hypothetical protein [Acidobacteriota bacterium]
MLQEEPVGFGQALANLAPDRMESRNRSTLEGLRALAGRDGEYLPSPQNWAALTLDTSLLLHLPEEIGDPLATLR